MKQLLFCLLLAIPLVTIAEQPSYKIRVNAEKRILVTGRFPLSNDTIFMFTRGGTPALPEGEATFVRNLELRDAGGTLIAHRYAGEGNYVVSTGEAGQWVEISYEIAGDHARYDWQHVGGVDEAAFATDDGFFFTGYTLFIVPSMELRDVRVEFDLPDGWRASTAWKNKGANAYEAESSRFMLNNCLMLGTHHESIIHVRGMEMRLAIARSLTSAIPLIEKTIRKVIPAYMEIFGEAPAPAYLVAMNPGPMTDGSAFRRSFSQIFAEAVDPDGIHTWGYIMAHEILHLWNGHAMIPAGQEEWFKEGFTDYLTNLVMRREGLIDDHILHRKLAFMNSRYWYDRFWQRDTFSIRESGFQKDKLRFGVYGGGAVVAMALEVEMRKATRNGKGVTDLFQWMYLHFAKQGRSYTLEDIIHGVNELTAKDMRSFFDKYVTGREFLSIAPYLEEMGLSCRSIIEEFYIDFDSQAREEQKAMYEAVFLR